MTTANAGLFLSFGAGMWLVSWVLPSGMAPTGVDGTSARVLWLQVVGLAQAGLGGGYLAWRALAVTAMMAEQIRGMLEPQETGMGERLRFEDGELARAEGEAEAGWVNAA